MRSSDPPRLADRIVALYLSRQFALYVACGLVSTVVQLVTRYLLSRHSSLSVSVVVAYMAGMGVALCLYRTFVFESGSRSLTRQSLLFVAGYLAFLPVTWGVSVGGAALLSSVAPKEIADGVAHGLGVAAPVLLNFAFNKAVTFEGADAPRGTTAARRLRTMTRWKGLKRRAAASGPEVPSSALSGGRARAAYRAAE